MFECDSSERSGSGGGGGGVLHHDIKHFAVIKPLLGGREGAERSGPW